MLKGLLNVPCDPFRLEMPGRCKFLSTWKFLNTENESEKKKNCAYIIFSNYQNRLVCPGSSSSTIRPISLFLPPGNHLPISLVAFLYFFSLQICYLLSMEPWAAAKKPLVSVAVPPAPVRVPCPECRVSHVAR